MGDKPSAGAGAAPSLPEGIENLSLNDTQLTPSKAAVSQHNGSKHADLCENKLDNTKVHDERPQLEGPALFYSEADREAIYVLEKMARIDILQNQMRRTAENEEEREPREINLSLVSAFCSHPDAVRTHLDSVDSPAVSVDLPMPPELVNKRKLSNGEKIEFFLLWKCDALRAPGTSEGLLGLGEPRHRLTVWTACVASLGCVRTPTCVQRLIGLSHTFTVEFSPLARHQIGKLFHPQAGYKFGIPWDFAKGMPKVGYEQSEEALHNNKSHELELDSVLTDIKASWQTPVCVFCWKGDDTPGITLSLCSRCKIVRYCGKACQAAHYKRHKKPCKGAGQYRAVLDIVQKSFGDDEIL